MLIQNTLKMLILTLIIRVMMRMLRASPVLLPYWSADRYKAPRVGSCKAIQDSIVTLSITDAFRSFVTFCIEQGGIPIYTLSLLNVILSITKNT